MQQDAEGFFQYRSDSGIQDFVSLIPANLKEAQDFIARNPKQLDEPETWFQLVIIEQESRKIIGDIGLHFLEEGSRQVELGYTLGAPFQGKGYATEAVRAVVDHLFTKMDKHRLTASIDPDNLPSIKLIERLGFRKEAHHVESLFFKGRWVDDLIYALLHREWKETN